MKYIVSLFIFSGLSLIFLSNSGGRGTVSGSPATTSPGESGQFCGSAGCHASGNFSPELEVKLVDDQGNAVAAYDPGETYQVNLIINHTGTPLGHGFQIVCLDSDANAINQWGTLPGGIQKVNLLGRDYVEHSFPLSLDTIPISWNAPEAGTGDITFYAAGNAVNLNGSPSGDGADTVRMTFTENVTSSLDNPALLASHARVFPNPVQDIFHLDSKKSVLKIEVYDMTGKPVRVSRVADKSYILGTDLPGVYVLVLSYVDGQYEVMRIVKN